MIIPLHPFNCETEGGTQAKIISIDNSNSICLVGEYIAVDGEVHSDSWDLNGHPASGLPERTIRITDRATEVFFTDVFYKLTPFAKRVYGQQWEEQMQRRQYDHFWQKIQ
ncbi:MULTISPECIES: hypothetical protein [Erwinia]|uniref:Uncharacterized protein n=2 Tax=Erwinia TaxID=551 RepID=A0A014MFA9_9GAMM|nr:hypothetical protein [Erwinia mallotivora]EXU76764.1 hypothetical protein BG55_03585 [Erwinia mallotivora]